MKAKQSMLPLRSTNQTGCCSSLGSSPKSSMSVEDPVKVAHGALRMELLQMQLEVYPVLPCLSIVVSHCAQKPPVIFRPVYP